MREVLIFFCFYLIGFFSSIHSNNENEVCLPPFISNSLLFPDRLNYVIFVFNKASTNIKEFNNLLETFIEMEEQSYCLNNNKTLRCPNSWLTTVQFGDSSTNYTFENGTNLRKVLKNNTELFAEAKNYSSITVTNFLWSKLCINKYSEHSDCKAKCSSTSTKEFYIIVSDLCFAVSYEIINPTSHEDGCSKFYRVFSLLMPNNYSACYLGNNILTPKNITQAKNIYSNMYIKEYFVEPLTSTVSLFAVIKNNSFEMVSDLIKQKLMIQTSTCRSGNLLGYFQIIDDYNDTMQVKYSIALPLYFSEDPIVDEWYFNYNFNLIYSQRSSPILYNQTCGEIKGLLFQSLNAGDAINQQVIAISDQDPLCFQLQYPWNKTKIHFELIVSSSINSSSDIKFMKNIDFNSNKSNHIYFYNHETNNNFSDYISSSSICSNYTPREIWDILFTPSPLPETSMSESWTSTTTIINPPVFHGSSSKWWYIGSSLVVIVFIIILVTIFRYRRKKSNQNKTTIGAVGPKNILRIMKHAIFDVQLSIEERQKYYIDKKLIYFNPTKILGKGSAAMVFEASYKTTKLSIQNKLKMMTQADDESCRVAIKVPSKFISADDVEEFIRELDALIKIASHQNIISFYGWTLHNHIPSLVTELAQTDLLQYVRILRGTPLPLKEILSILWQVTQALEHLVSLSMIHRDVACRNILLTESGAAKLADFGLCCQCGDESFVYRASLQKRLPVKWLSIESLVDRIFSEKTDVWAFAVLCYEVFSYGSDPYPSLANMEVLTFLLNGKRMEKPESASNEIYDLMLKCWNEDASERPSFNDLNESLRIMLENVTHGYGYLTLDNLNFVE